MRASAGNGSEHRDKLMCEPHKQFNSFDGVKQTARERRKGQHQYYHYQYEPYPSNYYAPGAAAEQPFM